MSSKETSEITYPHNTTIVFQSLIKAIPRIQGMKILRHDIASGRITVSVGISWKSWGESITLQLTDVDDGKSIIKFLSASDFALIDWGKNKDNIYKITNALHQELNTLRPIESLVPGATSTAGKNFCSHCGTKLIPNAKFCSACGEKLQ